MRTDMSHLQNAIEASLGLFATCSGLMKEALCCRKQKVTESRDNLTDAVLGDTSGPSRNTNCQ